MPLSVTDGGTGKNLSLAGTGGLLYFSAPGIMSTVTVQGSRYYWSRGNWFDTAQSWAHGLAEVTASHTPGT